MPEAFDPYLYWLGIRDPLRPPSHYRLLGVDLFESDPEVLANAADRQMAHVRTFQAGRHAAEAGRLLTEIAAARVCLLNPQKKAEYDAALWAQQQSLGQSGGPWGTAPRPDWPVAPQARAETALPAREKPLARDSLRTILAVAVFSALVVVIVGLFWFIVNLRVARDPGPEMLPGAEQEGVPGAAATPGEQPGLGPEAKPSSTTAGDARGGASGKGQPGTAPAGSPGAVVQPSAKPQSRSSLLPESQPDPDPLAGPPDPRPASELLAAARDAMRRRDMAGARRHLAWAEKNALPKDRPDCDRLREAFEPLDAFWRMVRRSVPSLKPGDTLALPDGAMTVVRVSGSSLVVQEGGQSRSFTIEDLPPAVALALAERSVQEPSLAVVPKIAFWTFDAQGDRRVALGMCQDPATRGLPTAALLGELKAASAEGGPATTGHAPARLPVPDEAAQAAARREIREVFQQEYGQSLKPAEKAALAERLLAEAIETKDNPVARYVLLAEVRDLSAASGNVVLLRRAIAELARSYDLDPAAEMSRTLAAAAEMVVPTAVKKELGVEALRQAQEALGKEDFDLALALAQASHVLALKGRDAATGRQAKSLAEELPERKAQHQQAQQALQTLASDPKHPEANLLLGKYLCFLKDRWGEGLPLLAKGNDPALQALAAAELAAAKAQDEPSQWIALADQWHEASKSADPTLARHFRARAVTWYKKALPALKGFTRARIERQIAQLEEG